jgi:hypothetical protein
MAANSYNPLVQPSQPLLRAPPQSPTAPRTMLAQSPTEEHKRTISSLESALFERILLLNVLVDFSGPHVDRGSVKDTVASSEQEFRRDFLDKIVYLCDIEKGGPTVTGSALQELQRCNVLWLAANEGISDNVMKFIDRVLVQLKNLTPDNRKAVENGIFGEAVRCAVHRISFYQLQLVKFATICRKTLAKFKEDSEGANTEL